MWFFVWYVGWEKSTRHRRKNTHTMCARPWPTKFKHNATISFICRSCGLFCSISFAVLYINGVICLLYTRFYQCVDDSVCWLMREKQQKLRHFYILDDLSKRHHYNICVYHMLLFFVVRLHISWSVLV